MKVITPTDLGNHFDLTRDDKLLDLAISKDEGNLLEYKNGLYVENKSNVTYPSLLNYGWKLLSGISHTTQNQTVIQMEIKSQTFKDEIDGALLLELVRGFVTHSTIKIPVYDVTGKYKMYITAGQMSPYLKTQVDGDLPEGTTFNINITIPTYDKTYIK